MTIEGVVTAMISEYPFKDNADTHDNVKGNVSEDFPTMATPTMIFLVMNCTVRVGFPTLEAPTMTLLVMNCITRRLQKYYTIVVNLE